MKVYIYRTGGHETLYFKDVCYISPEGYGLYLVLRDVHNNLIGMVPTHIISNVDIRPS